MSNLNHQEIDNIIPFKTNLRNYVEEYLSECDVNKSSINSYRYKIKYFLDYLSENEASLPQKRDVIGYKNHMAGKSKNTVRSNLVVVRQFCKWLVSKNILNQDPTDTLKLPSGQKRFRRDAVSLEMVHMVLEKSKMDTSESGRRNHLLFALLSVSGIRCIEASRARYCDIRIKDGRTILALFPKGGMDYGEDFIVIPDPICDLIQTYRQSRPDKNNPDPKAPLFVSISNQNVGQALTPKSISSIIKGMLADVGVSDSRITAHSLRHFAIQQSLLQCSLTSVQSMSRHRNPQILTDFYVNQTERIKNPPELVLSDQVFKNIA